MRSSDCRRMRVEWACSGQGGVLPHGPRVWTGPQGFVAVHTQVFVANPNKTQPIIDILAGNKDKLLRYLADFHSDKSVALATFS